MSTTPSHDSPADPVPEIGRLQATFLPHPFSAHGAQWEQLWKESYTPWDRGGPSVALSDLLEQHRSLFPTKQNPTALVPGCGRGYDVLLLSAFGYDVTGLDVSEASLRSAAENVRAVGDDPAYAARDVARGKGSVTWLRADFFDEGDERLEGRSFDLIYDYTFFCALPPEARPKWAKRMTQLLSPDGGRLVCLEWPIPKPLSLGGPPWGVSREAYIAHLSTPGEEVEYTSDTNTVAPSALETPPSPSALKQLLRIQPGRTHPSGYDEAGNMIDFISVWGHL